MNFESFLGAGFLLLSFLFFCAFFGQRVMTRRRKYKGRLDSRFFPTGTSLGNALHQLQSIIDPEVLYSIRQELQDAEEDAGDPLDPHRHLLRQASRIQRGTQVGPVTAYPFTSKVAHTDNPNGPQAAP
jgi:hypothetical protein